MAKQTMTLSESLGYVTQQAELGGMPRFYAGNKPYYVMSKAGLESLLGRVVEVAVKVTAAHKWGARPKQ